MTLAELETTLKQLRPGEGAHIPYEMFAELFPPGEPDEQARVRAYEFARASSCQIENHFNDQVVVFYKPNVEADDIPF
jgi:hypothetical protein